MTDTEKFQIYPVGILQKETTKTTIKIYDPFKEALLGLDDYSHMVVIFWFHESDNLEKRKIMRVHPMGETKNPLTGVFGTRSPMRPNPLALYTCKIRSIKNMLIHIDDIDAFDRTPVIDIKGYKLETDLVSDLRMPTWAKRR